MTDLANKKLTRRTLLRIGGCAGASVAVCGVTAGIVGTQTDWFDRLLGDTDTPRLDNAAAWTYADPVLTLNLDAIPELAAPSSAIRLEADTLPEPLLIVRDSDVYHVFLNQCPHAQKKLDLKGGELECTCISRSKFDLEGKRESGPAKSNLTTYTAEVVGQQLIVTLG
jgi:nitrite reductase/ring-hydroxylating ferredoxin subunit